MNKIIFKLLGLSLLLILLTNCNSKEATKKNNATLLLEKLKKVNSKGVLFGHQDDLAYGIGWEYDKKEGLKSDVEKATGKFPAVFGWDIGHIGDSLNIDGVPFNLIKKLIIKADKMGGVNTISWHPSFFKDSISSWSKESNFVKELIPGGKYHEELLTKLDHFSAFLSELKRIDGSRIPIIFRPWHEMSGNWFWWGQDHCENKDFKILFSTTIDYLRKEKGMDNLLITYAPDRQFQTEEEYLKWYPGDEYIDILAMDDYYDFTEGGDGLEAIVKKLEIVIKTATKKNKIAAFSETGCDVVKKEKWYTQELYKVLSAKGIASKISYTLVWRNNTDTTHFFTPYKGHPSYLDFKNFANKKEILLLEDLNKLTE